MTCCRSMRGSTLLEAAIACALLAVASLGVVAALLAAIRSERDTAACEPAVLVADSWAEMARAGGPSGVDWDASMSGLRHGKLVATNAGADISNVRVEWERSAG
ncbi:putative exported protein, partial [Burkholderia pseudomallei 354a]